MAKYRQINTDFWNQQYVASLSVEARLLYLYLKLNPHLNTAGFAKIPVDLMSLETGLDRFDIGVYLDKFQQDGKITYRDEYLVLREGHDGQTSSVKVKAAIDAQIAEAPAWIGECIMRGKQNDERASHPAIQAIRELTERFPAKQDWDMLIEILGDDFDVDLLVDAYSEWSRRGYNPANYVWVTDWYTSGKIPYKLSGRPTNVERLQEYREVFNE